MTKNPRHAGGRRLLAWSAVFFASACAGVAGAAGGRLEPGSVSDGRFTLGRPPVAQYGGEAPARCQSNAIISQVMNDLSDAAQRAGRAPPVLDPRVCAAAEAFLGWDTSALGDPRPAVLAFVSHASGMPATIASPSVAVFETSDEKLVAERLVQSIGNSVLNAVFPRLGIVVQRFRKARDTHHRVSVALLDAPVELDPFPRRLEAGQSATLSGRLVGGSKDPQVLVSDPRGRLSAPPQQPGTELRAEVACGDVAGRIQVELRGDYQGRLGIAASFPVACGRELPDSIAVAGEPWPTEPATAEQKIFELVNAERTAAGLAPLAWDAAVAGVARAISDDIADRGGAAGGPDLTERLKKEGIASSLVLQSAVAERSYERAHERLLQSPTNRVNIMNPDVTNAGVGAVTRADPEGRSLVYVTEVFIKELPPVDVAKGREALREAVARKRRDARAPALVPDVALEQAAQRYAEALAGAGGALAKEHAAEITRALDKGFKTVVLVSGARQEPMELAEEPQVTSAGKQLGVGIAQGRHPVLGRNAVYAVIMIGTPRK